MASDDARVVTKVKPPLRITHVNASWEEVCGYSRAEVIGRAGLSFLQVCALSLPPFAGLGIRCPLPHWCFVYCMCHRFGILTTSQGTWLRSTFPKGPNRFTLSTHRDCMLAGLSSTDVDFRWVTCRLTDWLGVSCIDAHPHLKFMLDPCSCIFITLRLHPPFNIMLS
jgi:hypothetical protein